MKKAVFSVVCLFLILSILNFSACMKVSITFPSDDVPVADVPTVNVPVTEAPQVSETTTVAENSVPVVLPDVTVQYSDISTTASVQEILTVEYTTAAPPVAVTPLEMSKGELLEYFNLNLNLVKEEMPAFKRAKLTTVDDIRLSNQAANTLVGFVKGALLSEEVEEKTAVKGSPCIEIMSPDGERYVSQLSESDIKDISVIAKGSDYEITVTLPDAVNPTKDEGAYGKIFNFITVDDVVSVYAPKVDATVERSNIKVTYSGCYAKATFSPDGKVKDYSTYVSCVISLIDASVKKVITINTDVDITLVSTTDFTDFAY